jgi:hypothetical protein
MHDCSDDGGEFMMRTAEPGFGWDTHIFHSLTVRSFRVILDSGVAQLRNPGVPPLNIACRIFRENRNRSVMLYYKAFPRTKLDLAKEAASTVCRAIINLLSYI